MATQSAKPRSARGTWTGKAKAPKAKRSPRTLYRCPLCGEVLSHPPEGYACPKAGAA